MVDVTLLTSTEYRKNYPGRALVDIDNVRSTTFPALPITADGDMFANLIDLHQKDKNSPIYVNPYYNDSNGTLVLNETVFMQNKIDSRPLDMIVWDFQGEVTFGRFPTDRTFTVVVYAERDQHSIKFAEGEVVLNYTVDTSKVSLGLTLLDAGDFYGKHKGHHPLAFPREIFSHYFPPKLDVAEDEFGCFDKSMYAPNLPQRFIFSRFLTSFHF